MESEKLYPNIVYFELAKEMPLSPIGSQVMFSRDVGGMEYLMVNGIEMPIDTAMKHSDWFTPISKEEHIKKCHENSIAFLMAEGKSKEDAEEMWSRFINS
jgi:hypothetical protein